MQDKITIQVCVSCRAAHEPLEPRGERAGAKLRAALDALAGPQIVVSPVECMSVCRRPCTIGFAAPGKWTYVYGDFMPDQAAAILVAADLYGAAPDGIIPWRTRPDALKTGVVCRIPPMPISSGADA